MLNPNNFFSMGIFDKVRLPLGIGKKNKFSLHSVTTTSQEFFSLRPVFSTEMMPNSDIRISHSYYCRLSPLAKPILGTGRIVNRAFFVPYRVIMPGFDAFIADTDYFHNAQTVRLSSVPHCRQSVLGDALRDAGSRFSSAEKYDFSIYDSSEHTEKLYEFTEKGRQMYAILTGLGYSISFGVYDTELDIEVSLMKLLAYFKIVADWYVNNNFYDRANAINLALDTIGRSPSTYVSAAQLVQLFNQAYYSCVDNDYFSTASVNPVTPPGASAVIIPDVTNDKTAANNFESAVLSRTTAGSNYPTTPVINSVNSGVYSSTAGQNISQFAIDALAALTSYMQRNNIVGYKTLDRIKARFGVELSADKLDRSYYLGSNSSPIRIDEVMSNADTTGAALGDYVGRGESGNKNQSFHYKNDGNVFGVFIILSTIIPDIHYGQGISRDNLHINRFDFMTPEMDALGMQAIARAELYNDAKYPQQRDDLAAFKPKESFGFQHTYSEYCRVPDILSGDFRRLRALDLRGFHLYRMFSEFGVENSPVIQDYKTISENFVVGNPSEYNKIFNYVGTDWDHFYCVHSFNINLVQPKKKLYDSYEFHDDNEGARITMDYKGTKLN